MNTRRGITISPLWDNLDKVEPHLQKLRSGELSETKAKYLCKEFGLEWFAGISVEEMEKIIWYLLINTDSVGSFIDTYDKYGATPQQEKSLAKLLRKEIKISKVMEK